MVKGCTVFWSISVVQIVANQKERATKPLKIRVLQLCSNLFPFNRNYIIPLIFYYSYCFFGYFYAIFAAIKLIYYYFSTISVPYAFSLLPPGAGGVLCNNYYITFITSSQLLHIFVFFC